MSINNEVSIVWQLFADLCFLLQIMKNNTSCFRTLLPSFGETIPHSMEYSSKYQLAVGESLA